MLGWLKRKLKPKSEESILPSKKPNIIEEIKKVPIERNNDSEFKTKISGEEAEVEYWMKKYREAKKKRLPET